MAKKKKETIAKEKGIELSPKYGLNPTITKCFWCGEDSGIACLGRIKNNVEDDVEAPKHMVLNYEVCPKCKKLIGENIMAIEVTEEINDATDIPIAHKDDKSIYPTGRWSVLRAKDKNDAGKHMFISKSDMDELLALADEINK